MNNTPNGGDSKNASASPASSGEAERTSKDDGPEHSADRHQLYVPHYYRF